MAHLQGKGVKAVTSGCEEHVHYPSSTLTIQITTSNTFVHPTLRESNQLFKTLTEKGSNILKSCLESSPGVTAENAYPEHKSPVPESQSDITPAHAKEEEGAKASRFQPYALVLDLSHGEELSAITGEEDSRVDAPPSSATQGGASQTQGVLLRERLAMYQEAEANAKATGESARARRLARGIKTLNELLKQAATGQSVSEEDIPPPVAVKKLEPKPVTSDTPPSLVEPQPVPPVERQPSGSTNFFYEYAMFIYTFNPQLSSSVWVEGRSEIRKLNIPHFKLSWYMLK
ncbi:Coiled-coil and C2 domain-containing protein 1A [Homalodisca vitripennis]|nr:Coiled-coil and C2 domain-containing protein 1A [Homalodisca vitripennis]